MIALASIQLFQNGKQASPPAADFHGFGSLFGVAVRITVFHTSVNLSSQVYAFMCHHSIPGLITPMRLCIFINLTKSHIIFLGRKHSLTLNWCSST
jgi:hypothetical protein